MYTILKSEFTRETKCYPHHNLYGLKSSLRIEGQKNVLWPWYFSDYDWAQFKEPWQFFDIGNMSWNRAIVKNRTTLWFFYNKWTNWLGFPQEGPFWLLLTKLF